MYIRKKRGEMVQGGQGLPLIFHPWWVVPCVSFLELVSVAMARAGAAGAESAAGALSKNSRHSSECVVH